jgi:hypothetical protein
MQIPPVRREDAKWARNDEHNAERFANHLDKKYFNCMKNKKVKQHGKQQTKKKRK